MWGRRCGVDGADTYSRGLTPGSRLPELPDERPIVHAESLTAVGHGEVAGRAL